jgi:hypothetical protein
VNRFAEIIEEIVGRQQPELEGQNGVPGTALNAKAAVNLS